MIDIPNFCNKLKNGMGKWSEQQEVKKEAKEIDKMRCETLGKFFVLDKLAFVGQFVSWITPLSTNANNSVAWFILIEG